MIDWVHDLAIEWGHWLRKAERKHGALQGTLGRVLEEGSVGAAIRSHGGSLPIVDFPEQVSNFHRAWLRLDDESKKILWVDYKLRLGAQKKFEAMNKKKDAYYRFRAKAHSAVMYFMAQK